MRPCKHPLCPDTGPCRKVKPKKNRQKIKHYSLKRQKENRTYSALRKQFLQTYPMCQAHLQGCTITATDVHHKAGRIGLDLINIGAWLSVCRSCHKWIEEHPKEAKENGFSTFRLLKHHK